MHRGEVFHLLCGRMILNLVTMTIIYFILVYPFIRKVCKALGKHQLRGWKCPESCAHGCFWRGTGRQSPPALPDHQGGCKGRGSMGHFRLSGCSAPHLCLPILMTLAPFLPACSQQCMQIPTRAGLAGDKGKLKPDFTSLSASKGL